MKYALPCQIYKRVDFETQPDGQTGNRSWQQQNLRKINTIFDFLFLFTSLINAKSVATFDNHTTQYFDTAYSYICKKLSIRLYNEFAASCLVSICLPLQK